MGMETPKSNAIRFPSVERAGITVAHTIHFRRPETPYSLAKMTTWNEQEAATQIQRLKALGYEIVEVIPPLATQLSAAPQ